MKGSIRNFLLINLLLTVIIATILAILGNYYLEKKDISNHLDLLLVQASFDYQALLGEDFYSRDLVKLQAAINQVPSGIKKSFVDMDKQDLLMLEEKHEFLLWKQDGTLLLHSVGAPAIQLSKIKMGFQYIKINGSMWRTFTQRNARLGVYITVTERLTLQTLLMHRLMLDNVYIILAIYPIAAILIWLIVGHGLRSILRVTHEVSHRAPNFLDPVNAESVPKEIKPLVIELNKLFQRLYQAIEREKRFAGDAAHELRTPLAALKTQAQVALKADPEELHKLLHNVIIGVDRCAHIVQQLLTLSRLVPEAHTLTDSCLLDLSKLAAEIVAQLAPLALDKDIDIELISDEAHPSIIQGNITALSILIRNLVDNAIRYTPENGRITIAVLNLEDKKIILKVIDNGPGIPAELRARVFERFFRVLGNKSSGSGLGLAIVQQIAQLHNAQLRLGTPQSGQGLEVEVTFECVHESTELYP